VYIDCIHQSCSASRNFLTLTIILSRMSFQGHWMLLVQQQQLTLCVAGFGMSGMQIFPPCMQINSSMHISIWIVGRRDNRVQYTCSSTIPTASSPFSLNIASGPSFWDTHTHGSNTNGFTRLQTQHHHSNPNMAMDRYNLSHLSSSS
jgi:hypothetical protein